MTTRRLLLLSFVINLALLAAFGWAWKGRRVPESNSTTLVGGVTKSEPAGEQATPADSTLTNADAAPAARPAQFDWRLVESEDYKKYIANLRAIGCPEETIRDIIIADVNKLFASRKQALNRSTNKFEFWKAGNVFANMIDEEKIQKQQELAKEKRALLKELLGVEPEEKPEFMAGLNPFETMLDFLPSSKQAEVAELFQKFQAKMVKGFNGAPDSEDLKNMQKAQKEMEGELAKILNPEELEQYQLRMSQTAMMMRMQLASFQPTEQEFRDIFKVKKSFDDDYGPYGMMNQDKAEQEKYKAAKKEMEAKLKTTLGEARFTEYERAQDWAYQGMYRVAERNNLGKEAANKVFEMKKAAEEEAKKVRANKDLQPDQRTAALQGIRTETENSIRAVFGDKAWESYQKQQGAYWIKGISPDPKSE
jgi:hypothetical protein